jgi:CDGSH-type Zn-finger protein
VAEETARITPYRNGPYLVRGPFVILDQDGKRDREQAQGRRALPLRALADAPLCDGTHKAVGFTCSSGVADDAQG